MTHTVSAGGLEVEGALGRYLRRKNRSQTAVNRCRDNSNLERPSYLVRYRRDKEGDIGNMPTKVSLYHCRVFAFIRVIGHLHFRSGCVVDVGPRG